MAGAGNEAFRKSVYLAATGLALALALLLTQLAGHNEDQPRTAAQSGFSDRTAAASNEEATGHEPTISEESAKSAISADADAAGGDQPISRQLDLILAGDGSITEFIAANIDAARQGDGDAAFYVSMALKECALVIQQASMTLMVEPGSERSLNELYAEDIDELEKQLRVTLPGMQEFARRETEIKLDRARDCIGLGPVQELYDSAREIGLIAFQADHPLAFINSTSVDWSSLSGEDLSDLQERTRRMIEASNDHQVFFFAAEVAAASLEVDPKFEKLSWAIAACEFNDCDILSRMYRGSCERLTSQGQGQFCSEDITDAAYLILKYPGEYDLARSRAIEIQQAILSENWEVLGL